jgi:hypothetical protein
MSLLTCCGISRSVQRRKTRDLFSSVFSSYLTMSTTRFKYSNIAIVRRTMDKELYFKNNSRRPATATARTSAQLLNPHSSRAWLQLISCSAAQPPLISCSASAGLSAQLLSLLQLLFPFHEGDLSHDPIAYRVGRHVMGLVT